METVVYLLGAGFSAPLGLPVMQNFRLKSQEMYFANIHKYAHFTDVFDTLKDLSVVKNFFNADLYNIEEILSILEMDDHLKGRRLRESFTQYIADVITHYTPEMADYINLPGNWYDFLFGSEAKWSAYGQFVGALLNLRVWHLPTGYSSPMTYKDLVIGSIAQPNVRYSIVTLNYDLILEKVCDFINANYTIYTIKEPIAFSTSIDIAHKESSPEYEGPVTASIAKLHGSIQTHAIVPPTWNKNVYPDIVPAWQLAYRVLADATQLRIIGYSLPTADAYIKFLLKSAIKENRRLKAIDVICRDRAGSAKARYSEFITFNDYNFINADVSEYLQTHKQIYEHTVRPVDLAEGIAINKLEEAHAKFVADHSS
ncbi:MAG TPA: hypothetical protein VJ183_00015 [Chloroflexia bacterium]|nr:hypothetical protein [Chloroflexia bacterium]